MRGTPGIDLWCVSDKLPDVPIKTPMRRLDRQARLRIYNGGLNLETIPDDPAVGKQTTDVSRAIVCDLLRIKMVQRLAVGVALLEDCLPTQTRLCSLRIRNSNNIRSWCCGVPHSSSW